MRNKAGEGTFMRKRWPLMPLFCILIVRAVPGSLKLWVVTIDFPVSDGVKACMWNIEKGIARGGKAKNRFSLLGSF